MKERPILFSGSMVRAILEGRKTQTRRVARFVPLDGTNREFSRLEVGDYCTGAPRYGQVLYARRGDGVWEQHTKPLPCPFGIPGDRLWVRETWCPSFAADDDSHSGYCYRATNDGPEPTRWRPSIYIPRAASRLTLEVTGVRVERLQAITEADARAEGVPTEVVKATLECRDPDGAARTGTATVFDPVYKFALLWDSINGKRAPWQSNPWVWVVEFERTEVTP